MNYKFLLLAVIAIVLVVSGCVSNLGGKEPSTHGPTPMVVAIRDNNTAVSLMVLDMNGAKSVYGLHVESPAIGNPDVVPNGTAIKAGKQIKIVDPNLAGKVQLVLTSNVDNSTQVILNKTL